MSLSAATLTASAFDGSTDGIVAFRTSGDLTVDASSVIEASEPGFTDGEGGSSSGGGGDAARRGAGPAVYHPRSVSKRNRIARLMIHPPSSVAENNRIGGVATYPPSSVAESNRIAGLSIYPPSSVARRPADGPR